MVTFLMKVLHFKSCCSIRQFIEMCKKAKQLSIQGPFFCMTDVQLKSSYSIFYNWKISDFLVKFALTARLSLLPTNFTKHVWNRNNDLLALFAINTRKV